MQEVQDALLQGASGRHVRQDDVVRLSDPVNAAEPLLDLHRVPRQVEVDHGVTELQVATLAGGLRAEEHVGLRLEYRNGSVLVPASEAAVIGAPAPTGRGCPVEIG